MVLCCPWFSPVHVTVFPQCARVVAHGCASVSLCHVREDAEGLPRHCVRHAFVLGEPQSAWHSIWDCKPPFLVQEGFHPSSPAYIPAIFLFFSFLYFLSGSGCLKVLFKCWLPEQFLVIESLNLTEHSFLPYYYHKATMYSFFFSLPFIFPRTHNVQLQHKKKKSPLCSLFFYEFLCICAKTNKQTRRRLAWSKTQYQIWCLLVFCWPSFLFFSLAFPLNVTSDLMKLVKKRDPEKERPRVIFLLLLLSSRSCLLVIISGSIVQTFVFFFFKGTCMWGGLFFLFFLRLCNSIAFSYSRFFFLLYIW